MILQSLHALYGRLKDDPAYEIAPPGYSLQRITFKIVLRPDGSLVEIQDARIGERKTARQVRVLGVGKPSGSALNPCLLWDNTAYMLGFKPEDPKPDRSRAAFEAFRKRHLDLEAEIKSPAFSSVCRFLETWSPDHAVNHSVLKDVATGFGVFQIVGETQFVHQDQAIDLWWSAQSASDEEQGVIGECLLTGKVAQMARLHPMIKGVSGGKALASLVGFNATAYESYGKEQSYNAPVSERAAFEYSTALNALLDGPMKSQHRMKLGDMTVVFWTDKPSPVENVFAQFAQYGSQLPEAKAVQDELLRQKIAAFLGALRQGVEKYGEVDDDPAQTKFFILGLSPNAARLSVRFFLQCTVRDLLNNLRKHYRDTAIERQYGDDAKRPDPEFPANWMLLSQTARESADISPILAGPLLRSIVMGTRYSTALYAAIIRRIHADREINYLRVCVIKGYLVRNKNMEVRMSLDIDRPDQAYRVGRLFAALEKTQRDALGDVGSTIRDRFYGSASATPRSVFPRLLRTYQHHLGKLEGGLKVMRERLVQEILSPVTNFPSHLNLADQGLFALGYYHQMQALYRTKEDPKLTDENNHQEKQNEPI